MWKAVFDCVIGTSHINHGLPCQDACRVKSFSLDGETILLVCSSDGAGSATHAADGAQTACDTFVDIVQRDCPSVDSGEMGDEHLLLAWCRELRSRIDERAELLEVDARQLACTFLGAIVGESSALFLQIGDGAIVTWDGDAYCPVFWPQSGQYANTTNFLTDDGFEDRLEWTFRNERINELAAFSDGLERLVLRFAERTVHDPFLAPLFRALRQADSPDDYFEPLHSFLGSEKVNARTDDDKTLILATRLNQCSHDDAIC